MRKIEAASPEAQSANLVAGNVDQLKALFPELVTEGPHGPGFQPGRAEALVGDATVTGAEEKYGLSGNSVGPTVKRRVFCFLTRRSRRA